MTHGGSSLPARSRSDRAALPAPRAPRAGRLHGWGSPIVAAIVLTATALVGSAADASPRTGSRAGDRALGAKVKVEVRVIEARSASHAKIDPRLKALARDLKSLPFQEFDLVDHHVKSLKAGERLSFQFPGPGKKDERFLVVTSQGNQGKKLSFLLAIDALKFKTKVAVPDGGTIVVGGPRSKTGNLMFAVTARLEK